MGGRDPPLMGNDRNQTAEPAERRQPQENTEMVDNYLTRQDLEEQARAVQAANERAAEERQARFAADQERRQREWDEADQRLAEARAEVARQEQARQERIIASWKQEAWDRYRSAPGASREEFEQHIWPPMLRERRRRIAEGLELSPDEQAVQDELEAMKQHGGGSPY